MDQLPQPIQVDGLTLWYPADRGSFSVRGLAWGTFELSTAALFGRLLHDGMAVVDLGANIGYYTLLSASLVGADGSVWSFEPDPDSRAALQRNVAVNGFDDRVHILPYAIGASDGAGRLIRYRADAGSSSLMVRDEPVAGAVEVMVTTLDGWAESAGWPSIDLMKMDVEGSEVLALTGMRQVCCRNPEMALVIEFNAEALESGGRTTGDFFTALHRCGFDRISIIGPRRLRPVNVDRDLPYLARTSRWVSLNLFCER